MDNLVISNSDTINSFHKTRKLRIIDDNRHETRKNNSTHISADSKKTSSSSTLDNSCKEHKNLLQTRRELQKQINIKNAECEEQKYGAIQKFFDKPEDKVTHKDLLAALQKLYITRKNIDPNYVLYFRDFIEMFARDTMTRLKFKRQHVFESICRLLLLFNYDNFKLGSNKQFYTSLEDFISGKQHRQTKMDILNLKVNESSAAGSVDILFEADFDSSKDNDDTWACELNDADKNQESVKRKIIMIQNKYYTTEKNTGAYDISTIFTKASKLPDNYDKEIVLMVNDSTALNYKFSNSKNALSSLIHKPIYDVKQLEDWFRYMLNDLKETVTIEKYLLKVVNKSDIKPILRPTFHQILFTNSTLRYNSEENYKLFIWGAVPRSGKSYMIANLISNSQKRQPEDRDNDIVLILGAKTETECQFVKMFCGFSDFDDYGIIVGSAGIKSCRVSNCDINKKKDKNIYIFSQEWFKNDKSVPEINDSQSIIQKKMSVDEMRRILESSGRKIKNDNDKLMGKTELIKKYYHAPNKKRDEDTKFKPEIIKKFTELFSKGQIDLYFDEVHKGGSTDSSENILHAFNNSGVKIKLFIMVSATFQKPNLRYSSSFIDTYKKGLKIIEWSYEDQQNMKQLRNITQLEMIINSREGIEKYVMENTFNTYKEIYGESRYLNILELEYQKHPELVLIQPEQINPQEYIDVDVRNIFRENLSCDACKQKQHIKDLQDPYSIFNDTSSIRDLLNFIGRIEIQNDRPSLYINSVYGSLQRMGATIGLPHSELWFLPDKDLYLNPKSCFECKEIALDKSHQDEENGKKTSLPNIEPLTRGLAFLLMETQYFKEKYNVLIVHNTKFNFKTPDGTSITETDIFGDGKIGPIFTTTMDKNALADIIKEKERLTYSQGKSLIILTGAKLRLGISLPCVDIAFNFDNIKSVDNNYQTMFRVLTERRNRPKKYGYYVDFNKNRAIQFLYEYNNTYGLGKKKKTITEKNEYLQSLLILFNYNGIGLIKQDTNKQLKLYNQLVNELKLDKESYQTFLLGKANIDNLIKSCLITVDGALLQRLKHIVGLQSTKNKKTKIMWKPENTDMNSITKRGYNLDEENYDSLEENKEETETENENEENEEHDNSSLTTTVVEILRPTVALLALFSNENNYNCATLNECIESCVRNIEKFEHLCSCHNINESSVFSCYMLNQSLQEYNKIQLTELLRIIYEMINTKGSEQLSINLNIIFDNIRESMGKTNEPLLFKMSPKDIQQKIEDYLPVRENEKNKFGEVFTPFELIEQMLDKLPPSVWKNPDLKWLDPANGIGNFPMVVYKKLMDKLPETYKDTNGNGYVDEKGKKKWIVHNMLFMVEINAKNIRISKRIFGENANICCANFLENTEKCLNQFGIDKFDIIMGNPPFQDDSSGNTAQGGHDLYPSFLIKSFHVLRENGYLTFITPPKWRAPDKIGELKKMWNIFEENNFILLKIFGFDETKRLFNGGISARIDYYILQKSKKYTSTIIIDEKNKEHTIDIHKWSFIPNYNFDNIQKILTTEENGVKVIYSRGNYGTDKKWVSKNKTTEYKYPIRHSHTIKDGEIIYWTNSKENVGKNNIRMFDVPKVILIKGLHTYPYNDYKGEFAMSNYSFGIPINNEKEGNDIVKAVNSEKFKEILKATKWSSGFTDHNMFKYFKPDFYKYFLQDDHAMGTIYNPKHNKKTIKKSRKPKMTLSRHYRNKKNARKTVSVYGKKNTRKNKKGFLSSFFFK